MKAYEFDLNTKFTSQKTWTRYILETGKEHLPVCHGFHDILSPSHKMLSLCWPFVPCSRKKSKQMKIKKLNITKQNCYSSFKVTNLSQNNSAENSILVFDFHFQIHESQLVCTDLECIICPQATWKSMTKTAGLCLVTMYSLCLYKEQVIN